MKTLETLTNARLQIIDIANKEGGNIANDIMGAVDCLDEAIYKAKIDEYGYDPDQPDSVAQYKAGMTLDYGEVDD